jgi:hypothetical protein
MCSSACEGACVSIIACCWQQVEKLAAAVAGRQQGVCVSSTAAGLGSH